MAMHLIQKQTVEVILNGTEAQALELQRLVASLCESRLTAAIEKVLDLYDNENIIIDYLSINVDGLDAGNLEEAITASVATQLEAALSSRAQPKRSAAPAPANDGNLIVYKRDAQSVTESRVELVLFHFLRTGVLLWWASPDQVKVWEAALLNLLSASPGTAQELRTLLYQHPAARQRFLLQFSRPWQQQILPLLHDTAYARTLAVRRILLALSPITFAAAERQFFSWQLKAVVQGDAPLLSMASGAMTQLAYAAVPELRTLSAAGIRERLHGISTGEAMQTAEEKETLVQCVLSTLQQTPAATPAEEMLPDDEYDSYYIHNAGLILLAPFIAPFLRNCGAADGNGLLREGYAAALLEYLATGRTGVGEHEMVFNKILCGIPVQRPIEKINSLEAAHIGEAEDLLRSVIGNWPVLKNTSIDGLRSSFLQRAGKLSAKDSEGNWLLQVESLSYDEWLLGELPWGYQVTALPFGKPKKLIWTEWI
ncbi:hypothetical protein EGT74_23995 [Chitinophaga lutea]|uniref:Uncharacterized protein n=1 Tax=Chitinophaga lutea TaxID=2488634 RepID=A0A3N4PKS8_9BACT|nr:contractile injection system tape measure protein [Chitinophaga lutea]RPE05451.1 hypothetical protein EGT74_23995 [Chitinophaga lutea]